MKLDFREAPPVKVTDFSHKKKYEACLLPATTATQPPPLPSRGRRRRLWLHGLLALKRGRDVQEAAATWKIAAFRFYPYLPYDKVGIPPRRYHRTDPSVSLDLSTVNESEWNKYKLSESSAVSLPGWMKKERARYLFLCQSWLAENVYLKVPVLFSGEAKASSAIKRKLCPAPENIIFSPLFTTFS